ncbi:MULTISPECIES: HAD family hydrolase [Pseudomonas]|jgi:HAD superfamily hydrolase (TIGR01509 family)|uniref:HAD family hydrolase n=1 Tax=Pseudomonas luteola TaxID=47886 RepID=A0A2X2CVX2_PSELU|nr:MULTISPECIES: HAD family hydrolase [Pseudomonas]ENA34232.1 HAD hydrolase, family IA [Pseudomonas sp. HPB0071]MBA1249692.1 HAD family hydrolase [Pseudomonas zeshuii]MBF8641091.1 HAD family hydrolase [Pseudomonas zeshuii]QEU31126.1 HAD family hydrolase [Pseudomonas luteola]RRW48996.1 HAD family hydrolase [Pseudomonas luteola]
MKPHVIELLISDCDGVLVDSEILSERIVMDELSRHAPRTELEKLLEGTFGLTTRDIIQRVEERFGITLPEGIHKDIRTRAEQLIATQVEPIPGVKEALERIDLPLAVASNSQRHSVVSSVARAGLTERVAGHIFSADMVEHPKPAPDVYLLAARTMGVSPENCLVIEDSATGVRAALAAGMRVIGFTGASHIPPEHGETLRRLGVTALISHMDQLPQQVAALRETATSGHA